MVRLEPLPPNVIFPFGTRVVFEEVAVTVRDVSGVSTSPTVKGISPVAMSSFVDLSVILLMVGRSFKATTVKTKVSLAVLVPSLTVTVMVLMPLWLEAGVMLIVRFAPVPARAMFVFGTRVVFDEVAVTVKEPGVSTSPTVKAILPVAMSSFVDLSVISLMVGRSLTAFTVNTKVSLAVPLLASLTVTVIVLVPV